MKRHIPIFLEQLTFSDSVMYPSGFGWLGEEEQGSLNHKLSLPKGQTCGGTPERKGTLSSVNINMHHHFLDRLLILCRLIVSLNCYED
jgi:hypothetical protein